MTEPTNEGWERFDNKMVKMYWSESLEMNGDINLDLVDGSNDFSIIPRNSAGKIELEVGELRDIIQYVRKALQTVQVCYSCDVPKTITDENFYYLQDKGRWERRCRECRRIAFSIKRRRIYNPEKEKARRRRIVEAGLYKKYNEAQRKRDNFKERARYKFRYAVKMGRVKKEPCIVCGDVKSEGHHEDYTKPLEVMWLCRKHHSEQHHGSLEGLLAVKATLSTEAKTESEGITR